MSQCPGITLPAPVPAFRFDTWNVVGGKSESPRSHSVCVVAVVEAQQHCPGGQALGARVGAYDRVQTDDYVVLGLQPVKLRRQRSGFDRLRIHSGGPCGHDVVVTQDQQALAVGQALLGGRRDRGARHGGTGGSQRAAQYASEHPAHRHQNLPS